MAADVPHKLQQLESELSALSRSPSLPVLDPQYSALQRFTDYTPSAAFLDLYGDFKCVLNRDLEVAFAPKGRLAGPCPFQLAEGGPALISVVAPLRRAWSEKPGSALVEKWIDDFLLVSRHYNSVVCSI